MVTTPKSITLDVLQQMPHKSLPDAGTPIWHELAPVYDVPEFGSQEPFPVPSFDEAMPCAS